MSPLIVGSGSSGSEGRSDRFGLPTGTSDPGTAEAGDLYYKTDTNKIRVYDGSAWADLASGGGGGGAAAYTLDNSLRFDSASLSRTPSSAGNRKTWTWSGWIKRSKITNDFQRLFSARGNAGDLTEIVFNNDSGSQDALVVEHFSGGVQSRLVTTAVFRDVSAWYHIVVSYDTTQSTSTDRVRIWINGSEITSFASGSYPNQNVDTYVNSTFEHRIGLGIDYTVPFDGYMADVHLIDGQALAPTAFGAPDATTGVWNPIEYTGTYAASPNYSSLATISSGAAASGFELSKGFDFDLTNRFEGDTTGAYVEIPYSAVVSSGSVEVYVGVTATQPLVVTLFNGGAQVGSGSSGTTGLVWHAPTTYAGPITSIRISRTNRAPEFNAIRVNGQILYDTYGQNSFNLDFANAGSLGTDVSGNDNSWTPSGVGSADQMKDSPTNGTASTGGDAGGVVVGNYCTWNPLLKGSSTTLSNGNLDMSSGAVWQSVVGTIGVTSGKWYWEQTMTTNQYTYSGICNQKFLPNFNSLFPSQSVNSWAYLSSNGNAYYDQGGASAITVALTTMASGGGTLGFALDLDNQKLWFSLNGTWMGSGSPTAGTNATFTNLTAGDTYFPCADVYNTSSSFNFGQTPFLYAAPSGYRSLNTANIEPPSILNGSEYFDVVTYDGNAGVNTISDFNFVPSFAWLKARGDGQVHALFDTVRGSGQRLQLGGTSGTSAEGNYSAFFTGFTDTGFTLNNNSGINQSGINHVAWAWRAGSPETAATGSVVFDGSGDYLQIAYNSDWDLSNSDFTIEAFINSIDTATNYPSIIGRWQGASGEALWDFRPQSTDAGDNFFFIYNDGSSSVTINSGAFVCDGGWHHLAVTRSGTNLYMFVDGDLKTTHNIGTATISNNTNVPLYIGYDPYGASYYNGFISNLRLIKGSALYTSNFTPPTTALTNVTNTKLLCCQSTTSATTAAVTPGTITANGNAAATTYNPLDAFSVNGTGYSTASAASITEGTIPLTGASVNLSAATSIVTWTGTGAVGTIGHGLNGAAPGMIIVKARSTTDAWYVYHSSLGATKRVQLNELSAETVGTAVWNSTPPTSTVFSIGSGSPNSSDVSYVAYCFSPIESYSAFGSYVGNTTNFPFVYLGFRPKWLLVKASSSTGHWTLIDTTRSDYNVADNALYADLALAEDPNDVDRQFDILSNGFKLRQGTSAQTNGNGVTYLYAAFAENPFSIARAR